MIVTKKIVRTYVVEMTEEQAKDLISICSVFAIAFKEKAIVTSDDCVEVVSDLRESLLNG